MALTAAVDELIVDGAPAGVDLDDDGGIEDSDVGEMFPMMFWCGTTEK